MGLPKGWLDYKRVGNKVHGTNFIAFKVPLKEGMNRANNVDEEQQLYPKLLVELIPNLGLIIDLTNTTKYYYPEDFISLGIAYEKIAVEGHIVPKYQNYTQFKDVVNNFLASNHNEKLIGVHCTHGLNRSGFLICRYMIEELKIPPLEAIAAFELARGHKMERENYTDKLKCLNGHKMTIKKLESLAIESETEKATQTNPGYWIDENNLTQKQRAITDTNASVDASEHIQKQVQLVGCVNVQQSNLIPDGRGNFFLHVMKKDIKRHEPQMRHQPQTRREPQMHREPKFHREPHMSRKSQSYRQMPQSNQYDDRTQPRNRTNQYLPAQRYNNQMRSSASHSMSPKIHHAENAMFGISSSTISGDNRAEDLLKMQHVNSLIARGGRRYQPF